MIKTIAGIKQYPFFPVFILCFTFFSFSSAYSQIRLPKLISNGMVLQREMPLKINGWASPGEKVSFSFRKHTWKTTTGPDGKWTITLPPQQPGGPWEMTFTGKNILKVTDVMVGDVWICSGQSNMVLPMERVKEKYPDEMAGADFPEGLPASPFRTFNPDSADARPWHGKSCCVVLTYDDGLNVHLDNAIPLLDSLGLRATFYIPAAHEVFSNRSTDWKRAAANGHELGNHTLFHPCNGSLPGRTWVNPDYDLKNYTVRRFMEELKAADLLLSGIDGKKERSFAYT